MKFTGSEEQLEILREIADNISDPVFLVDRMRNVWYFNRAFEAAVGVRMNSKRYRERPCSELLGLDICGASCCMLEAINGGQTTRLAEIHGHVAGGDDRNFQITAVPVANASDKPFGALIFLKDVTAETRIHEKYKELVARNSSISLSGQIEEGNLLDVIQLFAFLQKTGELSVKSESAEGSIIFENGRMANVQLGMAQNAKALDRLLQWRKGGFSFRPTVTREIRERITVSSDFMLMDAVRERDELKARANEMPTLDTSVFAIRPLPEDDKELGDIHRRVCQAASAGASLRSMLEMLPEPDTRICLALMALRDRRVIGW
jgi:hypothetical protein